MVSFITTTSDKVPNIAVSPGQIIFSKDNRVIYTDNSSGRTEFNTIIILATEQNRQQVIPVTGFYFVQETSILWRYESNKWVQLTSTPDNHLVFCDYKDLPAQGVQETLYCTPDAIYQWSDTVQDYVEMGSQVWEPM